MKIRYVMLSILLAVAFTVSIASAQEIKAEVIEPYNGSIGPGSALYGLKIAFENIGETFTFGDRAKLEVRIENARERIAEAKAELRRNNRGSAERALELYRAKVEAINSTVPGIAENETLLEAQREIARHQFVLEQLRETHPDVPGLERAFENSLRVKDRFENKTEVEVELEIEIENGRERIKIKEGRKEKVEFRERTRVRAQIVGNNTEVRVEVEFPAETTDRTAVAQEILNRLKLNMTMIDRLLEIQVEEGEDLRERLEARAEVKKGITRAEAEFRFPLSSTTNRAEIVEKTFQKLQELTLERIVAVLEFRAEGVRMRDETKVKAEIIGNDADVRVEVKFTTEKTDRNAVAAEIKNRLSMSRENIAGLLRIEAAAARRFTARLTGSEEVPPVNTPAQAEVVFDLRDNSTLRFRLTVTNIANVTASHIHLAPAGQNGPVVVPLFTGPAKEGRFDGMLAEGNIMAANLAGPLAGQQLSALIDAIVAGNTYVNVHTAQNPAGEIRGQLRQAAAPTATPLEIRERLEAKAEVKEGVTEAEAEFRFVLPGTTGRDAIVEGIFNKLSALTIDRIVGALEFEDKDAKEDKREDRRGDGSSGKNDGGREDR